MLRNRAVWQVVLFGSFTLEVLSCGGNSHPPTSSPVWSATTSSTINVVNVATGPSGTPDCAASWISNLQNISKATSLRANDAIQIVSWNDYEHGDEIEAGIDSCVTIAPSVAGSVLSWQVSGNADAIDHFQLWDSSTGQTFLQLASVPATSRSYALSSLPVKAGIAYSLVVQAIGKPSVFNKVSPPITYVAPASGAGPSVTLALAPSSGVVPLAVSATASVSGSNSSGATTSIDFGDGSVVAGSSATHTYSAAGNYTVTATSIASNGLSGKASGGVVASSASNPAPVAQLAISPGSGVAPLTVNASTAGSTTSVGSIVSSKIDFGDGTVVTGTTASHTYANPGNYQAIATITNSGGLSSTANSAVTATPNSNTHSAASLYVYPATAVAPRGSYQTITAIVNGVNDKTVTWSTSGGSLVGTNPCVVNEPCTIALYTATPGTYSVTATSNADGTVTATSVVTITPSPTVTTGHPRLIVTSAMLPALRAKATSGNAMYQAMLTDANTGMTIINGTTTWTQSTWSGSSCTGGGSFSNDISQSYYENYGYYMAFISMIAPTPTVRNIWGCRARDIFMYMINYWQNPTNSVDINYGLSGNHAADTTLQMSLMGDWLMAGGYLSPSDLNSLRAFFAVAAKSIIHTNTSTGSVATIGNYNSPLQFDKNGQFDYTAQRAMGNNYSHSKEMYLTAIALTFDDNTTDDPPLPNTCSATRYQVCPDGSSGSLHAYWTYLWGGMLYKDWAHVEDPAVTQAAYNTYFGNMNTVPQCHSVAANAKVNCLGEGRGGESSEGSWYQYSMLRNRYALNAIHTAGYDDPVLYGPQISYATSSWWEMKYVSDFHFLTGQYGTAPWISYNYWMTGDSLGYNRVPTDFAAITSQLTYDSYIGRTDHNNAVLWIDMNTSQGSSGGVSNFDQNMTGGNAGMLSPDLFIVLGAIDPQNNPPSDPRPSFPKDWYNGANQHIIARSGWTSSDTAFSYYCPNTAIDHELEWCGRFDIYKNGEYITKGRTVFNNYNSLLATSGYSNTLSLINAPTSTECTIAGSCFEGPAATYGGQFFHDYQSTMSTVLKHNEVPAYVAAEVDMTGQYNSNYGPWANYSGITHASRSLVYLRESNQVVYYDRGLSGSNAWDKMTSVTTMGSSAPTISGKTVSWLTSSGDQKAFWTSLLPISSTISSTAYVDSSVSSDVGVNSQAFVDAGAVTGTQFLTVLEWGSSSFSKSATSLVQSSAGTSFDGALVGNSLAMFKRNWTDVVSGVTYAASGATTHYISDLLPNSVYTITGVGTPATVKTDNAGVAVFASSGTGNITIAKQ